MKKQICVGPCFPPCLSNGFSRQLSGGRLHGFGFLHEACLQLRGEATPERLIDTDKTLALTHNLGGYPGEMVSFVSVVGTELG